MEGFEKGKELVLRGNFTPGYMRRGVMDFRWKKEELKTETLVLAFMRGVNGFEIFHRSRGGGGRGGVVFTFHLKI